MYAPNKPGDQPRRLWWLANSLNCKMKYPN
jgi:hypothetical protein